MDGEAGGEAVGRRPAAIEAMLASRAGQGADSALVATPHRPLILGLRFSKVIASLSFAVSGHFAS